MSECREKLIDFQCYEMKENGIISKHYNKLLSGSKLGDTLYRKVNLKCVDGKKRDFLYHRVLAYYFIPNPQNKPEVDHLIPLSKGGVDEVSNLRWVTSSENSRNKLTLQANKASQRKNTLYVYKNGELYGIWESENAAARELGLNQGSIHNCASGKCKTYKGYNFSYELL